MYLGADYRQGGLTAQVLFVHGAVHSKVQQKIQKNHYSIDYQYFVKKKILENVGYTVLLLSFNTYK